MGHAVRANYLYAGVADLYLESGEEQLMRNLTSICTYFAPICTASGHTERPQALDEPVACGFVEPVTGIEPATH